MTCFGLHRYVKDTKHQPQTTNHEQTTNHQQLEKETIETQAQQYSSQPGGPKGPADLFWC